MKLLRSFIAIVLILSLTVPAAFAADDSGTFRGKWWNYYDRGVSYAENGQWDKALEDFRSAISRRDKDQRMARTYGMHFIDYFPHREIGVAYLELGDVEKAAAELEESVRHEESAKAVFYLNKVKRARIMKQTGGKVKQPAVSLDAPAHGAVTRASSIRVSGRAGGEGLVSKVLVGRSPYRFDMAKPEVAFSQEVPLSDGENSVVVRAEDMFGNTAEQTVRVTLDREGPSISVFDVVAEDRGGAKKVRIIGEVSDNTGIREVSINGKKTAVNDRKGFEFDLALDRSELQGRIVITAIDRVENETSAELDVAKELAAFGRKPELVQLALSAGSLFSSDKEAPVVRLKDPTDIAPVYLDKYYVDGEASDNTKVEKIVVNGAEVPNRKGKKVFFSRMVSLKEGKNRIVVETFDAAGNRAVSEFTVTRNVPDVMQMSSRMSVTVLPFEVKQKATGVADLAYDHLIGSFLDQKRFNVIERAKLEQVLQEQKIAKSKLADPEHTIRVGKLMSAEAILATSIKEDAKSIEVVTRVINTETSEVMEVKDVFSEEKGAAGVKDLMEGLAAKIATAFPVAEGIVIKHEGREVYSDIGDTVRVRKSTGVIVYRKGKEIKHPVTGKSLGWDTVKLAEGRFDEVQKDFSKIRLLDKGGQGGIAVKDLIITK